MSTPVVDLQSAYGHAAKGQHTDTYHVASYHGSSSRGVRVTGTRRREAVAAVEGLCWLARFGGRLTLSTRAHASIDLPLAIESTLVLASYVDRNVLA